MNFFFGSGGRSSSAPSIKSRSQTKTNAGLRSQSQSSSRPHQQHGHARRPLRSTTNTAGNITHHANRKTVDTQPSKPHQRKFGSTLAPNRPASASTSPATSASIPTNSQSRPLSSLADQRLAHRVTSSTSSSSSIQPRQILAQQQLKPRPPARHPFNLPIMSDASDSDDPNNTSAITASSNASSTLPTQELKLLRSILTDESYYSVAMDDDTVGGSNNPNVSMESLLAAPLDALSQPQAQPSTLANDALITYSHVDEKKESDVADAAFGAVHEAPSIKPIVENGISQEAVVSPSDDGGDDECNDGDQTAKAVSLPLNTINPNANADGDSTKMAVSSASSTTIKDSPQPPTTAATAATKSPQPPTTATTTTEATSEPFKALQHIGASARSKMRQLEQSFLSPFAGSTSLPNAGTNSDDRKGKNKNSDSNSNTDGVADSPPPQSLSQPTAQLQSQSQLQPQFLRKQSQASVFRGLSDIADGKTALEAPPNINRVHNTSSSMSSSRIFEDSTTSTEDDTSTMDHAGRFDISNSNYTNGTRHQAGTINSSLHSVPTLLTPSSGTSLSADLRRVAALELLASETSQDWSINDRKSGSSLLQHAAGAALTANGNNITSSNFMIGSFHEDHHGHNDDDDDGDDDDFDLLLDVSPKRVPADLEANVNGVAPSPPSPHTMIADELIPSEMASQRRSMGIEDDPLAPPVPQRNLSMTSNLSSIVAGQITLGDDDESDSNTTFDNAYSAFPSMNGAGQSDALLVAPLAPGESSEEDDNIASDLEWNKDGQQPQIQLDGNGHEHHGAGKSFLPHQLFHHHNQKDSQGNINGDYNDNDENDHCRNDSTGLHPDTSSTSSSEENMSAYNNASNASKNKNRHNHHFLRAPNGHRGTASKSSLAQPSGEQERSAPLTDDPLILRMPNTAFGICLGMAGNAVLWKTVINADFLVVGDGDDGNDGGEMAILEEDDVELVNTILWFVSFVAAVMVTLAYLYKCVFHHEFFLLEWRCPTRIHFCNGPNLALLLLTLSIPDAVQSSNLSDQIIFTAGLVYQVFMTQIVYKRWMFGAGSITNASTNASADAGTGTGTRSPPPPASSWRLTCAQPQFFLSIVGWFMLAVLGVQADIADLWGIPLPTFCLGIGTIFGTMVLISVFQGLYSHEDLRGSPALTLLIAPPSVAVIAIHGIVNGTLSLDHVAGLAGTGQNASAVVTETSNSSDFFDNNTSAAAAAALSLVGDKEAAATDHHGEFPLAAELILGWCCFMVLLLLRLSPRICKSPSTFGAYWAYVFPMSSLATALTRYGVVKNTRAAHVLAVIAIALSTLSLVIVFCRMLWHMVLTTCTERYTWADPILNLPSDSKARSKGRDGDGENDNDDHEDDNGARNARKDTSTKSSKLSSKHESSTDPSKMMTMMTMVGGGVSNDVVQGRDYDDGISGMHEDNGGIGDDDCEDDMSVHEHGTSFESIHDIMRKTTNSGTLSSLSGDQTSGKAPNNALTSSSSSQEASMV